MLGGRLRQFVLLIKSSTMLDQSWIIDRTPGHTPEPSSIRSHAIDDAKELFHALIQAHVLRRPNWLWQTLSASVRKHRGYQPLKQNGSKRHAGSSRWCLFEHAWG